jgi:aryl-phospho-beta-D-glucosidase BglC (GH1 family)
MLSRKQKRAWLIILVVVLLVVSVIWAAISSLDFSQPGRDVKFGVTFNHKYASQDLGLDWTEVYWAIINDLGVKDIRLAMPWDLVEQGNNEYNFTDWEWMIEQAAEKDINIILVIGRRTPRWPECHDPLWLEGLSKKAQEDELLEMLKRIVNHFKKYNNIVAWQVENEPLLDLFGRCPKADKELLAKEVELVRQLDERPIIITDTGQTGVRRLVWLTFWELPCIKSFGINLLVSGVILGHRLIIISKASILIINII